MNPAHAGWRWLLLASLASLARLLLASLLLLANPLLCGCFTVASLLLLYDTLLLLLPLFLTQVRSPAMFNTLVAAGFTETVWQYGDSEMTLVSLYQVSVEGK